MAAGAISAHAERTSRAQASALKGSSCAHPYEAHWGQSKFSIQQSLLGDTHYISFHRRKLPHNNDHTNPLRWSYSWHALNGAHMCEFHVWVTDAYVIREGEPDIFGKPVTLETPLDSHNPHGGRNVVAYFKDRCGPIVCGERNGRLEYHEVLTAAR